MIGVQELIALAVGLAILAGVWRWGYYCGKVSVYEKSAKLGSEKPPV